MTSWNKDFDKQKDLKVLSSWCPEVYLKKFIHQLSWLGIMTQDSSDALQMPVSWFALSWAAGTNQKNHGDDRSNREKKRNSKIIPEVIGVGSGLDCRWRIESCWNFGNGRWNGIFWWVVCRNNLRSCVWVWWRRIDYVLNDLDDFLQEFYNLVEDSIYFSWPLDVNYFRVWRAFLGQPFINWELAEQNLGIKFRWAYQSQLTMWSISGVV